MTKRSPRKLQLFALLGLVCLPPSGAALAQNAPTTQAMPDISPASSLAPQVNAIDVKPGDRWTYKVYDDITGDLKFTAVSVLTEAAEGTFTTQTSVTQPNGIAPIGGSVVVFDNNWDLIEDGIWKRNPADTSVGVKLPLQVGNQWKGTFDAVRQNPEQHFAIKSSSSVAAWEHVKLRFGLQYDAFRIESISHGGPIGVTMDVQTKVTSWYAPQVNHYVKRITEARVNGHLSARTIEYLAGYTRRTDN